MSKHKRGAVVRLTQDTFHPSLGLLKAGRLLRFLNQHWFDDLRCLVCTLAEDGPVINFWVDESDIATR